MIDTSSKWSNFFSFVAYFAKMPEIQLGRHTVKTHGANVARVHMHDWIILLLLVAIEIILNVIEPFHRFVGKGMMTDLRYPYKEDTLPFWSVPVSIQILRFCICNFCLPIILLVLTKICFLWQILAILLPLVIFTIYYFQRRDVYDLHHAILGISHCPFLGLC